MFKSASVKPEAKTTDAELARLQAFVLDPVGPLTNILHRLDEEDYSLDEAKSDVSEALRLLGNASSQISRTRRKKVLKSLNPDIQDLAGEEDLFKAAAPNLFGAGFEAKMKDRAESVKLLSKAKAPPPQHKKFFRGGRSTAPRRGSGHSQRGGKQWQRQEKPGSHGK